MHRRIVPKRKLQGLAISCLIVFLYLFITVYFDYIRIKQNLDYLTFDFKTVTAGDYTVEMKISQKAYQNWLKNYYQEDNMLPEST